MLVQIEKCYRYCKKYKRKLYVDGSVGGFLDDFANYFISHDANISFDKIDFLSPPFDVFPKCLYNDLYDYEIVFDKRKYINATKEGVFITFSFDKNYDEQILVHAQGGGGITGIFTLSRLSLKKDIKLHIRKTIEDLKSQSGKKSRYDAIHVRNTSVKTDYKSYFTEIKNKISKTTVICTDDYECQQYAKAYFGQNIMSVTDIPDLSSCPVKRLEFNKHLDRYKTNVDTLTDLFILACADRVFFAPIISDCYVIINYSTYLYDPLERYIESGRKSGYQILAKNLHDNKKIISNMLYEKENSFLSYHLALLDCHFRYNSIVVRKSRTFFILLSEKGILHTFKYMIRKIIRFVSIRIKRSNHEK